MLPRLPRPRITGELRFFCHPERKGGGGPMNMIPMEVPNYSPADFSQETWWLTVLKAVFIIVFLILNVLLALWVERRTIGRMQTRPGPNVAGPFGLFQAIACLRLRSPHSRPSASSPSSRWVRMFRFSATQRPCSWQICRSLPCISLRFLRWACTASFWVVGPRPQRFRSMARCVPRRR